MSYSNGRGSRDNNSPAGSNGSQNKTNVRYRSPGMNSNGSQNGISGTNKTGNRLYSPSGNMRSSSAKNSPTAYAAHQAGASRVRREPAVAGSIAANNSSNQNSNSRQRAAEYAKQQRERSKERSNDRRP